MITIGECITIRGCSTIFNQFLYYYYSKLQHYLGAVLFEEIRYYAQTTYRMVAHLPLDGTFIYLNNWTNTTRTVATVVVRCRST